jgi:ankyrin repeat protein
LRYRGGQLSSRRFSFRKSVLEGKTMPGTLQLLAATWHGNVGGVMKVLQRENVDPNARSPQGIAALHVAAYLSGERKATIGLLIGFGARVDEPEGNYGWTPLHIAAGRGLITPAEQLLEAGAQINVPDKTGATPLDLAELSSESAMAEFLRQRGAQRGSGVSAAGTLSVPDSKAGGRAGPARAVRLPSTEGLPGRTTDHRADGSQRGIARRAVNRKVHRPG